MAQPRMARVLLVEDHTLLREGLKALLERFDWVEVVGEAEDGAEGLALIAELRPDAVFLDITLPKVGGLQVLSRVTREYPDVKVLVLSMHDNEEFVSQAIRAGAKGYLIKQAAPVELGLALRAAMAGDTYLSPQVSNYVVTEYLRHSELGGGPAELLTPRQREILQLIAEGHSNHEIADILGVSIRTVETHRAKLMERLDIHDVVGLVRFAMRMGLIPPEE